MDISWVHLFGSTPAQGIGRPTGCARRYSAPGEHFPVQTCAQCVLLVQSAWTVAVTEAWDEPSGQNPIAALPGSRCSGCMGEVR